jgi:predicted nucleic acid-binding protein
MLYLDTSALLKLYIREPGSAAVQSYIASQDLPLPIWEIQEIEFINALRLKVFWKELSTAEVELQIEHFKKRRLRGLYLFPEIHRSDLMNTFYLLSSETPRLGCRTMDILHVACAVQLETGTFITFDARQRALALHAGLLAPILDTSS